jgi:hypothetical protein
MYSTVIRIKRHWASNLIPPDRFTSHVKPDKYHRVYAKILLGRAQIGVKVVSRPNSKLLYTLN